MLNRLRDLLIDGLLLALPLGAALYLLRKVLQLLTAVLVPVAHLLPQGRWFGIAMIEIAAIALLLVLMLLLGLFARSALGRRVAEFLDGVVLSKIPGYLIAKTVAASFASDEREGGLQPALVSFDDNQVLGLVAEDSGSGDRVAVFVPGAPGAASGNVVIVSRERVQRLDTSAVSALNTMKQRGVGVLDLLKSAEARTPTG